MFFLICIGAVLVISAEKHKLKDIAYFLCVEMRGKGEFAGKVQRLMLQWSSVRSTLYKGPEGPLTVSSGIRERRSGYTLLYVLNY